MNIYEASIDRITETNQAVILVAALKQEFLVDANRLPEGAKAGTRMTVTIEENEITSMTADFEKTEEVASNMEDRMKSLRSKHGGSSFRRK